MKTINMTVYLPHELPTEEAKQKAYDKLAELETSDSDWADFLIEQTCVEWAKRGYSVNREDVLFSGFWSQGDGASFTGDVNLLLWLDVNPTLAPMFAPLLPSIKDGTLTVTIERLNTRYAHAYTMDAVVTPDVELDAAMRHDLAKLEAAITADARHLADELYKDLEETYEDLTARENLDNVAAVNDYYFDVDGELV